jgi:hypothetical protein
MVPLNRLVEKTRDEWVNGEILYSLKKAQAPIRMVRRHYNTARPHRSFSYFPQCL